VITVPFRACLGLNTRSDPSSLAYDPQTSSWEAARLLNLDVLDGGRRWRNRPGYSVALQFPAPPHSPQVDGDIWYVAAGDTLYRVAGMVKTAFLTNLTPGLRLGWCRLGQSLYWSNGVQQGRITDGQAKGWGGIPFSSDQREAAEYATVSAGNVLAAAAGRVWIGVGNDVVYTAPGYPHHVRVGSCRLPQSSAVRMIAPVDGGLYVGTDDRIVYLAGFDPGSMQQTVVSHDPVIPRMCVPVLASDVMSKLNPVRAYLWATARGLELALPEGNILKLTFDKVAMNATASGGAILLLPRRAVAIYHP
jgi:hypothetical protein